MANEPVIESYEGPEAPRLLVETIPDPNVQNSVSRSLLELGYHSVFDITAMSRQRFIKRHEGKLSGMAAQIHDRANSYARQLAEEFKSASTGIRSRAQPLTQSRSLETGLPTFSELFDEPWDSFCHANALESQDSPVSYLVDLFKTARQIELDADDNAVTLDIRRPDIAKLVLDTQNTYQELPALEIVNDILLSSANRYLTTLPGQQDKTVNQVLGETRFPFKLPFSLPHMQISLGLEQKDLTLGTLIQQLDQTFPWGISNQQPGAQSNAMIAAADLSPAQTQLVTQAVNFPQVYLTRPLLLETYLSASTTGVVASLDLSEHAYVVMEQDGVTGPLELTKDNDISDVHETITVTCRNAAGTVVSINLRAKNVRYYKRRKLRLEPFPSVVPFDRKLELSYDAADNAGVSLTAGPYFGDFTVQAREFITQENVVEFTYRLVISSDTGNVEFEQEDVIDFFEFNYGAAPEEIESLKNIEVFSGRTKCSRIELEKLLCVKDFSPKVSRHYTVDNSYYSSEREGGSFPQAFHYGAVYINGGQPDSMSISAGKPRTIINTSVFRYDRLNRFIRLQRWLQVPHDKLDLLVMSAIRAEVDTNLSQEINTNTIRVLGVFRHLNRSRRVTAEKFASFIHELTPFAIGSEVPFLDKVFNASQLFDTPLSMDRQLFNYAEPSDSDETTVKQLCAGLGVSLDTFSFLAAAVNDALNLPVGQLKRSLPVVSALYRLVELPKLFGLSPEEGLMLLDILKPGVFTMVAGRPRLSMLDNDAHPAEIDILDIILAMETTTDWLRQVKLSVFDLGKLLKLYPPTLVSTEPLLAFFEGLATSSYAVLLKEQAFPAHPEGGLWMAQFSSIVDNHGLIKPIPRVWGISDQSQIETLVGAAIGTLDPALIPLVTSILVQAKSAQDSIVANAIAKEYGVSRDLPPLILSWAGSSAHSFLANLHILTPTPHRGDALTKQTFDSVHVSSNLVMLAYDLSLHCAAVKHLSLSFATLQLLLAKPQWLGITPRTVLNNLPLSELYLLSRYCDWLAVNANTEDDVQAYLAFAELVDGLDEVTHNQQCTELLAELLDWSKSEVLQASAMFTPPRATALPQIDWLRRLQSASLKSGLSVSALLQAASLTRDSTFAQYGVVGEAVAAAIRPKAQRAETLSSMPN
jgi:hypothetical protein